MAKAARGWRLGVALVAALVLRFLALDYGLPFPYANLDDRIVTDHAVGLLSGDWNPHYFAYPSLPFELHALAYLGLFAGGFLFGGRWSSLAEFRHDYWLDPTPQLLMSRGFHALLGVATAWAAAALARELLRAGHRREPGDRRDRCTPTLRRLAPALAALAVALHPLHCGVTRTANVDTPVVLFVALTLVHALKHLRKGSARDLWLAALLGGLAASCKYYGALLALPIAAAALLRAGRERAGVPFARALVGRLALAGTLMVAAFLVTSPFVVLDFDAFARDFAQLRQHVEGGHYGHDPTRSAARVYGTLLVDERWGFVVAPLGLLGLAVTCRRRAGRTAAVLLLLQVGVHFGLIATFKAQPPDYTLVLLPALAAGAGIAVAAVGRGPRVTTLLGVALLVPAGGRALADALALRRPDTRVVLRQWLEAQVEPGARVAADAWLDLPLTVDCLEQMVAGRAPGTTMPVRLGGSLADEQLAAQLAAARSAPATPAFDFILVAPQLLDLGDEFLGLLAANDVRWLVLSGKHAARTNRIRKAIPALERRADLYDRLLADGPWVAARFDPATAPYSGPELVVCDLTKLPPR